MSTSEQLRLLSTFHYVVGGLHALIGSVGFLHFFMGISMLLAPQSWNVPSVSGTEFVPLVCVFLGAGIVLFGWAMALCTIVSGRYIARRTHRSYCLIIGAINCAMFPFGTTLGIFDILLLTREDVRQEFPV